MKIYVIGLIVSLTILTFCNIQAQDVSINITPIPGSIFLNKTRVLQVVICNEDADPIAAPANKIRPIVSFPDFLTITSVTNGDGTPLTNWTIESIANDPGNHTLRMLNSAPIPNAECFTYNIVVTGNTLADFNVITSSIFFKGPQTPGDDPANNNSTTQMEVVMDAMPVTLVSFDATKEASSVNLTWSTTEETNSERFDVQRSANGKDWETFQTVAAKGESKVQLDYAAVDNDPFEGDNFYRLHMIDKDGTSAYSRIRTLKFEGVGTYIYPNPVSDELTIDAADWSKVSKVRIIGSNGKEVYKSIGKPSPKVDVKNMQSGIYLVQLTTTNGSETTYKIVVNK
jgi:hypothetical protein